MEGRDHSLPVAATKMDLGTDVNFGSLTRSMFTHLQNKPAVKIHFNQEVESIDRLDNGAWQITVKDLALHETTTISGRFVFIGAPNTAGRRAMMPWIGDKVTPRGHPVTKVRRRAQPGGRR